MKTLKGKITPNWDKVSVIVGDEKILLNEESVQGKSYYIGEEVEGFIIDSKFNVIQRNEQDNKGTDTED